MESRSEIFDESTFDQATERIQLDVYNLTYMPYFRIQLDTQVTEREE